MEQQQKQQKQQSFENTNDPVRARLDALGISYTVPQAPQTGAGADAAWYENAKILFLKEHGEENYYLVVTSHGKHADIKSLRRFLGVKPLSLAAKEALDAYLSVTDAALSPLAVINDTENRVTVIIDDALDRAAQLCVLLPDGSALALTTASLEAYIEGCHHTWINMQV